MNEAVKNAIVNAVTNRAPCRPLDLYDAIIHSEGPEMLEVVLYAGDLGALVEEIVNSGDLTRVEYSLPYDVCDFGDGRVVHWWYGILFPGDTKLRISSGGAAP